MREPCCQVCGAKDAVLRRLDGPLELTYRSVVRKLPRGSLVCIRHHADYRGIPGAYVSRKELVNA